MRDEPKHLPRSRNAVKHTPVSRPWWIFRCRRRRGWSNRRCRHVRPPGPIAVRLQRMTRVARVARRRVSKALGISHQLRLQSLRQMETRGLMERVRAAAPDKRAELAPQASRPHTSKGLTQCNTTVFRERNGNTRPLHIAKARRYVVGLVLNRLEVKGERS
jgi:hypothetical protein